jgi:K+-transporting ATPase ATPase C chain
MRSHLRGSLLLLVSTVLVCCVLYPLVVWGVGRAFHGQAEGSLILKDGKPVGSRLIAQSFAGDKYFWPRPSAVDYNASASGASNWGASNPKLRERVARTLGPIVRYRSGGRPDVAAWLEPERVRAWAEEHPDAATWWFEADKANNEKLLAEWQKADPQVAADWKKANPDKGEPSPAERAVAYFTFYAGRPRDRWPSSLRDVVQSVFFDAWLGANPTADLEPVPADAVMASGSGLDPHITHRNARYQARRVAEARGRPLQEIEQLVDEMAKPLMGGIAVAGPEKLVNVLELNLALDR